LRYLTLSLLILWAGSLWAQRDNPLQKRVTIRLKQATAAEVLAAVEQQSGLRFHYDASLLNGAFRSDFNVVRARFEDHLRNYLLQFGLTWLEQDAYNLVLVPQSGRTRPGLQYRLSGTVADAADGEKLIGVIVRVDGTYRYAQTNEQGYFSLLLPGDSCRVSIYYPGFSTRTDTFAGGRNYLRHFRMYSSDSTRELEIQTLRFIDFRTISNGQSDQITIGSRKLGQLPFLFGEPDLIKAFMFYPGVSGGSEGLLGLHIRGGSMDQNLILLDGVPVFNPYHLYGIFGVFHDDLIKRATLSKGSFDASKSGRLSGVVSVQTRDGDLFRWKGSAGLGTLASRVMLEGPIVKGKTSIVFSARRSHLDFMADVFGRVTGATDTVGANGYYFYDATLRLSHRFSERSRLGFSFYTGEDRLYYTDYARYSGDSILTRERRRQESRWGNTLASLQWDYHLRNGLTLHQTLWHSAYNFNFEQRYAITRDNLIQGSRTVQATEHDFNSGIEQTGFKSGLEWTPLRSLRISSGLNASRLFLRPGLRIYSNQVNQAYSQTRSGSEPLLAGEFGAHVQADYTPDPHLRIQAGLHQAVFGVNDKIYSLPQPRLQVRWSPGGNWWLRAGYSRMQQFFHLLTNPGIGLPGDLWVPSTDSVKPELAAQWSGGITWSRGSFQFSAEVYHKAFSNLIEYRDNADYLSSAGNWESSVTAGSGTARGYEFMLEKHRGSTRGWLAYTWSRSERSFAEIENGRVFPFRYDRRHNVQFVCMQQLAPGVHASAAWTYQSGFAVTLPLERYPAPLPDEPFREIFIYGARNDYRTPANHRLDITVAFEKKTGLRTRTWTVGVFNAYNHINPFYLQFGFDDAGRRRLQAVGFLPLLPNVQWKMQW
jgi:hypothetical protein